jgi:hypothetical protein
MRYAIYRGNDRSSPTALVEIESDLAEITSSSEAPWRPEPGFIAIMAQPQEQPEPTLDAVKSAGKRMIEAASEACRLRFVTPGSTKAMEYIAAHLEAQVALALPLDQLTALPNGGPDRFPILAASVPLEAPTLLAAAELIDTRATRYARVAGAIKRLTLDGKIAVDQAATSEEVAAAVSSIEWPAP